MLLTLENIQNQQFNQRFRGYDMAEVDAFLDKIAESYLFVSTENTKLKEELTALKNAQNQSLDEEQSFKNAIISAQAFADDLKNKAQASAARLQQDAKEKSTAILEATQGELQSLQEQINILAGEKDRIKEELRSFLNSYLAQVDGDTVAPTTPAAPVETVSMDQVPEPMTVVDDEPTPEPLLEMEEPPVPPTNIVNANDDVAILYEKIDLNDDFSLDELSDLVDEPEPAAAEDTPADPIEFSTDELDELDMSDLDGDMLYSLDDPLDNPEPAVVIDPLDSDKK